jgi:hypothetical protein
MPKVKTITNLTAISDTDLLKYMVDITLRNPQYTPQDKKDLAAINREFQRRDRLTPRADLENIRKYKERNQRYRFEARVERLMKKDHLTRAQAEKIVNQVIANKE